MILPRARTVALTAALGLGAPACRAPPASTPARPTASAPATTDGGIALGNLEVQIAAQERRLATSAELPALASAVELRLARARLVGDVRDYDRAETLAERAVAASRTDPRGPLARATIRGALHRFPEALADVAVAERRGADPVAVRALRASILQARGSLAEARGLLQAAASERPGITTLGQLATVEAAMGDAAAAERDFDAALHEYRDTSPFPVAWIEFQRGLAAESAGRLDEASARYETAAARVPRYAEAVGHLANLEQVRGRTQRAEALLRRIVGPGIDPQYEAQLAGVLDARGDRGEAERLRADARARYERLLATHREAYADHAARFLLATDSARALELAEANLAVRQTWDAYDLALRAARAASATAAGCRIASDVAARGAPPASVSLAASEALLRCASTPTAQRKGAAGP